MDLETGRLVSKNSQSLRRWLSAALMASGLVVLVAAAGLLWMTQRPAPEPPAALGLADNPLPVIAEEPVISSQAAISASATSAALVVQLTPPQAAPSPSQEGDGELAVPLAAEETPVIGPLPVDPEPPVRIAAPAVALDAPVAPVGWKTLLVNGRQASVWEVAENAAGWHKGSVMPGQVGNTVLSGHHNTGGEVFRYVVDLEPGDEVLLFTDHHVYTYMVESRLVLPDRDESVEKRRENARWIANFPDERLTLVTCWPYHTNTHRVIVVAKPAP